MATKKLILSLTNGRRNIALKKPNINWYADDLNDFDHDRNKQIPRGDADVHHHRPTHCRHDDYDQLLMLCKVAQFFDKMLRRICTYFRDKVITVKRSATSKHPQFLVKICEASQMPHKVLWETTSRLFGGAFLPFRLPKAFLLSFFPKDLTRPLLSRSLAPVATSLSLLYHRAHCRPAAALVVAVSLSSSRLCVLVPITL